MSFKEEFKRAYNEQDTIWDHDEMWTSIKPHLPTSDRRRLWLIFWLSSVSIAIATVVTYRLTTGDPSSLQQNEYTYTSVDSISYPEMHDTSASYMRDGYSPLPVLKWDDEIVAHSDLATSVSPNEATNNRMKEVSTAGVVKTSPLNVLPPAANVSASEGANSTIDKQNKPWLENPRIAIAQPTIKSRSKEPTLSNKKKPTSDPALINDQSKTNQLSTLVANPTESNDTEVNLVTKQSQVGTGSEAAFTTSQIHLETALPDQPGATDKSTTERTEIRIRKLEREVKLLNLVYNLDWDHNQAPQINTKPYRTPTELLDKKSWEWSVTVMGGSTMHRIKATNSSSESYAVLHKEATGQGTSVAAEVLATRFISKRWQVDVGLNMIRSLEWHYGNETRGTTEQIMTDSSRYYVLNGVQQFVAGTITQTTNQSFAYQSPITWTTISIPIQLRYRHALAGADFSIYGGFMLGAYAQRSGRIYDRGGVLLSPDIAKVQIRSRRVQDVVIGMDYDLRRGRIPLRLGWQYRTGISSSMADLDHRRSYLGLKLGLVLL